MFEQAAGLQQQLASLGGRDFPSNVVREQIIQLSLAKFSGLELVLYSLGRDAFFHGPKVPIPAAQALQPVKALLGGAADDRQGLQNLWQLLLRNPVLGFLDPFFCNRGK